MASKIIKGWRDTDLVRAETPELGLYSFTALAAAVREWFQ